MRILTAIMKPCSCPSLLILGSTMFLASACEAQHRIHMVGGPSFAWMDAGSSNYGNLFPSVLTAHAGGLGWSYRSEKRLEFGAAMFHERRGAVGNISLLDITGNEIARGTSQYRWDHFTLPVSIGFRSAGRLQALGAIGIVPAYTLHAEMRTPAFGGMPHDLVHDLTAESSVWTLGGSIEAGGAYALNDRFGLRITGRYYHGMIPVEFGVLEWSQRSVSILMGLEFTLGKGKATE